MSNYNGGSNQSDKASEDDSIKKFIDLEKKTLAIKNRIKEIESNVHINSIRLSELSNRVSKLENSGSLTSMTRANTTSSSSHSYYSQNNRSSNSFHIKTSNPNTVTLEAPTLAPSSNNGSTQNIQQLVSSANCVSSPHRKVLLPNQSFENVYPPITYNRYNSNQSGFTQQNQGSPNLIQQTTEAVSSWTQYIELPSNNNSKNYNFSELYNEHKEKFDVYIFENHNIKSFGLNSLIIYYLFSKYDFVNNQLNNNEIDDLADEVSKLNHLTLNFNRNLLKSKTKLVLNKSNKDFLSNDLNMINMLFQNLNEKINNYYRFVAIRVPSL